MNNTKKQVEKILNAEREEMVTMKKTNYTWMKVGIGLLFFALGRLSVIYPLN